MRITDQAQEIAKGRKSAPRTNNPGAGWSSPVARQAHNLKVAGSNPAPASKETLITRRASQQPQRRPQGQPVASANNGGVRVSPTDTHMVTRGGAAR